MSSIRRSIQVIDLLASSGPLGVRAVAQQLNLPVGSIHRLLLDLSEEGVAERNGDGGWQLGCRLAAIVDRQLDGLSFPRLLRPYCEAIAASTRETVNVNVLSGLSCVCIDRVRGSEGMQLDWPIGSRAPLHCGGSAKAMLAFLDTDLLDRALAQPLVRFTGNTIVDPIELRAELARIRARGYAVDNQEMVVGVFCVGVPVLDRAGRAMGAISVSGPRNKAVDEAARPLIDLLSEAAASVSRRLGYAGAWPGEHRHPILASTSTMAP